MLGDTKHQTNTGLQVEVELAVIFSLEPPHSARAVSQARTLISTPCFIKTWVRASKEGAVSPLMISEWVSTITLRVLICVCLLIASNFPIL